MKNHSDYSIARTELVFSSQDVHARIMTLAPQQTIPWHYHSEVTDYYFVLSGILTVETKLPAALRTLAMGERYKLVPRERHCLSNRELVDCQFLLLQGVGRYDWIKAEP